MRALYNTLSSRFTLSNKTKKRSSSRSSSEKKNDDLPEVFESDEVETKKKDKLTFEELTDYFDDDNVEKNKKIIEPPSKKKYFTYKKKEKPEDISFDNLYGNMPEPHNHFILPNVPTTPIYMFPKPPNLTDKQYNKTREDALELIPDILNGHLENTRELIQIIQKCHCLLNNNIKNKIKKTFKLYNDYCDKVKTLNRHKNIGGKTKKYKRKNN
jgi:hypothetical protein